MIQRSSFVTTTWRVSHLVSILAYAAYFCVRPVYSECCYSYSEQKLAPAKTPSPTSYSVALTASSWAAINSPGMTYKTTVAFSSGYFIELIPAGCILINQLTVSCTQTGKSMLNLAFQKVTAVGDSGGSYLFSALDTDAAVVGDEEKEGRVVRGVRKDYSTVPGPPPTTTATPQPPPAVVSVQICGEFCTLSASCPTLTPNMTATPTPTRPLNATATSTSLSKTTASPANTGQMLTPSAAAPVAEPANTLDKTALIIGSVFAVVVVAFAVGYALMRRKIALGGRGGKKKKEADQEDIKYIRPTTPAPPALPQPPAPVATPATAAMTMRQLTPPSQQSSNTSSARTATNTAAAAAAPTLARGRSVREAARNDRPQPPAANLAGGGNAGADMRYLQERQQALAMNANTSASSRSQASAQTYTLPQPPPPSDPVNVSVPVSISTMDSLPLPVSTAAAVNRSTSARAAPAKTRVSNNSDSSAIDTADLEFLVIPASRQKNGTPSSTPPQFTRGAEKEEVLDDVNLDDDSYDEREEALLKNSKSMRYPQSSRRGADAGGNGVAGSSFATTAATVSFADTSPLRRTASTDIGGSSGSRATTNYNNSSKNYNNDANTSNYYPQQQQSYQQPYRQQQQQQRQLTPQQQQQQYQQKQQKMGWAQSQEDLLMRARSLPRTTTGATSTSTSTTTAMNGGFPPRTMNTQQQQQQQQRADPRGLYGYL
ncbi:hypothetical protein K457DRAFT_33942 [Linnemannia elongata AG-77]|uniref:Uncharacterized protein n=1 Tax=Linnemannia elongata AG-77 TaxID=1314771 RepID=A0A197JQF5_9FUNG|nr:hypothetical protein K457DRAFT_33942 [Linnemannia elongata AG-77]